ncbi:ribonuclease PH [Capilliphycus salinus ALCB114379]|uniref:ribonuclease PH n=1 Tax=Capilliphycus salinus TaxID=2768948 RepID=UPI0039A4CB1C
MVLQRLDDRKPDELRSVSFELDYTRYSEASVLTKCGNTQVICNVTIQPGVPKFLQDSGQGWLTAEYRMLPGATQQRQPRELMKLSGRTQEIQRLIGRSLRAAVDLKVLGEKTVIIDADVIQADAGTRTASITGGFVALANAFDKLVEKGELEKSPISHQIAAVSVGLLEGEPYLDLDYEEDVAADIDFNIVMNDKLGIIELQGTAEAESFTRQQLNKIMDYAEIGIKQLLEAQRQALNSHQ